jgi:hypothetical protein
LCCCSNYQLEIMDLRKFVLEGITTDAMCKSRR